jgi:hypothetical protein
VTDPAHCVEGAATVRGLVFYVEAEKEAAAAAAALATRAAGWKKGSDGNDLGIPNNDFLALLLRLIETYVSVAAEERITIALWILHTHVFHQFHFTPRLLVISPIENCGKTTVLRLIEQLAYEPNRSGGTTAASIYHQLEHRPGITLSAWSGAIPACVISERAVRVRPRIVF